MQKHYSRCDCTLYACSHIILTLGAKQYNHMALSFVQLMLLFKLIYNFKLHKLVKKYSQHINKCSKKINTGTIIHN